MDKKYEFTGETKACLGCILHRIRAVRSFGTVQEGTIGGWIKAERNLSHYGDAWIGGDAEVYGDAEVSEDAKVYGYAVVCGNAEVYGDAKVYGNAEVYGDAEVYGNAEVYGDAEVCGKAEIGEDAKVYGDAVVCGNARVCGDAVVCKSSDYMVFKNCWSSMRWFTYTWSNRKWKVGCFHGTGDELIKKAYADSEASGRCYEAIVNAMNAIEKERKSFPDDPYLDFAP